MTQWIPDARCHKCRRRPNVAYSAGEVAKAKRERQGANVNHVQCPRCRTGYWIKARDIANARPQGGTNGSTPPPLTSGLDALTGLTRAALAKAGVTTLEELLAVPDLSELPGIGPSRVTEIEKALDGATAGK